MAKGSPAVVIEMRGVTRRFERAGEVTHALGPLDLTVRENEFISLIGPSGCGKSTLLNIVAGLLPRSQGTVRLEGMDIDGPADDVGMMFQAPVLLEWRTALENVLLPIEIREGRSRANALVPRARDLLELVGLSGAGNKYPLELSGGMQQRVAICRMLITDPALLLLDEPFGALDEFTRERMNAELERLFIREGKTAVFVTHSIQEAVFLSTRIVVMTGRPGTIAGIVEVDLARPRDPEIVTTPEFQRLVRATRELLDLGHWASGAALAEGERSSSRFTRVSGRA